MTCKVHLSTPCKRHLWKTTGFVAAPVGEVKDDAGNVTGWCPPWGILETATCRRCDGAGTRWTDIKADSCEEALRAYGCTEREIAEHMRGLGVEPTPAPTAAPAPPSNGIHVPLTSWPFPVSTRYPRPT